MSILVTQNDLPQRAIDLLKNNNYEVTIMNSSKTSIPEILKIIPNYDAVLGKIHIDADFLDKAGSRLKIVSTPSAGYDHMNVDEIKKRGIKVGNTPSVLSSAVAEIAIFLLIGVIRRVHEGQNLLQQGKTKSGFQYMLGHDLRSKTIGIAGFGNIGEKIAKRLVSFEVEKFLYTGHSRKKTGDSLGAEFVSQDRLLKESDVIINCLPLTNETENIFNDTAFEKMKKTCVFVNIGRGKTVDTQALVRALKDNKIYGAGLDVTEPEPLPVDHELLHLPNALVIPHMGSQTIETRTDMAVAAAQNIINGLQGKNLLYEL